MNKLNVRHINTISHPSFWVGPIREKDTTRTQEVSFSSKETAFSLLPVTVSRRATSRLSMLFQYNPVTTRYCNQEHLITLANNIPIASTNVATVSGAYPLGTPTVTLFDNTIIDDLKSGRHKCKNIV